MSKMEECEIKGQKYRLMKLTPLEGGRLATLVGRNLAAALDGDAIKSLISGYAKRKEAEDKLATEQAAEKLEGMLDQASMLSALAGGVAKINADELYSQALTCIRGNLLADHKLHDDTAINLWFDDRPSHLLPILAWALKVNCAGFFGLGEKA